jgi:hypothetical protein
MEQEYCIKLIEECKIVRKVGCIYQISMNPPCFWAQVKASDEMEKDGKLSQDTCKKLGISDIIGITIEDKEDLNELLKELNAWNVRVFTQPFKEFMLNVLNDTDHLGEFTFRSLISFEHEGLIIRFIKCESGLSNGCCNSCADPWYFIAFSLTPYQEMHTDILTTSDDHDDHDTTDDEKIEIVGKCLI